MDRRMFLQSKLTNTENNYHGSFRPRDEHIEYIFKPIYQSFLPMKSNKDIVEFASKPDLDICKNITTVILTNRLNYEESNALKFHLYLNFLANWREYDDFKSKVRLGGDENLKYDSISLTQYYELSFRNSRDEMVKYQDVDILFLFAGKYIYESREGFSKKYYYELLRRLIESRGSVGLITIVFFDGNDKELKPIEDSLFGVPYKKEYLIRDRKVVKEQHKNNNSVSLEDSEVFE